MSPNRPIQLVGGGGHALVVLDAARAAGFEVVAFWDDDREALLRDHVRYAGVIADLVDTESEAPVLIAIGGLASRRHVIERLIGRPLATIIHPGAIVSPSAVIGRGSFVGAGAVVNPLARVGAHAIINTSAIVEHECVLGENVHLGPRSVLGGNVAVGADSLIGLGAAVLPQTKIGARCVIGSGAVVTHDIPDRTTAVGVPARPRPSGGAGTIGLHGAGI